MTTATVLSAADQAVHDAADRLMATLPADLAESVSRCPLPGGGLVLSWEMGRHRVEVEVLAEAPCTPGHVLGATAGA